MKRDSQGLRLRLFLRESLRFERKPLYEYVVHLARREGMAGATVFRGIEGFGQHRHIHTMRLVDVSDDLPIIVEMIDTPEKIRGFLGRIDGVVEHGVATVSPVEIVKYAAGIGK